jgi:uncharacterized membrane protein HdeD (DUF308 family)
MTAPRSARPDQSASAQPSVPRQGTSARAGGAATGQPGTGRQGRDSGGEAALPAMLGALAWPAVLTGAVAALIVGVLLLAWPTATLTVVAILLGAALVATGLLRLFEGFTARDRSGGMRVAYVIIGLIAIGFGLFCLRHRDVTIFLLAFLLGAFWIMHGITDLAVAASGGVPGRGVRAITGVLALAAGTVVLFWPGISLVLLLTVLGAWLLCYGVMLALLAFRLRHWSRADAGEVSSAQA